MPLVSHCRDRNGVAAMNKRVIDVLSKTFLFLEELHAKQPSDAQVYRIARLSAGVKFRDIEARDFLVTHFRGQRPRLDLAENGKSKSGTLEEFGQETGKKREDATRRRRTNTITVPTVHDVASQQPLFAAETAKKEKAKKPRAEPRPGHLILDAVGRLVGPRLVAQTITLWRQCNATIAHDMAAAGITPEMAARDWQRAHAAGDTCITLKSLRYWMQEAKNSSAEEPKYIRPTEAMLYAVAN